MSLFLNRNKPPPITRNEILQKFKPKINIYGTNFDKFKRQISENYDSPSRSTSSMSSDSSDSSDSSHRRRIGKRIQPRYTTSTMGPNFSPFEDVEELNREVFIPEMDPYLLDDKNKTAKLTYYKLRNYLNDLPRIVDSIDFNQDEIDEIQKNDVLNFMFTSLVHKLNLINQVHAFSEGGKFKKSKRKYKSRKGGKYIKTRKGGFGSTFTKGGKGGKSKNKKTRKH